MNIANMLTWLRVILAPIAYLAGLFGDAWTFGVIYGIGVFTDTIDGSVARFRNESSKRGSALDTIADVAFFPSALCVVRFFPELSFVEESFFVAVLVLMALMFVTILFKGAWSLPHLFSTKAGTSVLNVFVLVTVFVQFYALLFYLMLAAWFVASVEKMIQVMRA